MDHELYLPKSIGAALERALNRGHTRNIGRGIRDNIQRSLRAASITVQVEADRSLYRPAQGREVYGAAQPVHRAVLVQMLSHQSRE
nr:hypothetical protein [Streptomyces adustus]